jgi:EAL domain-containing protein (putative c-di-GMP-specific phosphodiesterase class I)
MSLSELIHHFNSQPQGLPGSRFASRFRLSGDARVFVHFANLVLESVFLPITAVASGRIHGHAAALRVFGLNTGNPVSPDAVFVLPADDDEFVWVDRLVRTLHALSYLAHPVRGTLLLKVNRRHVMSVPSDHGLRPQQITLEIDADGIEDVDHFSRAIAAYRQRGYVIALSGFGRTSVDLSLLSTLHPDIVKFDRLLLASARPLEYLVDRIHDLGASVAIEGPGDSHWQPFAGASRADLMQRFQPVDRPVATSPRQPPGAKATPFDQADATCRIP